MNAEEILKAFEDNPALQREVTDSLKLVSNAKLDEAVEAKTAVEVELKDAQAKLEHNGLLLKHSREELTDSLREVIELKVSLEQALTDSTKTVTAIGTALASKLEVSVEDKISKDNVLQLIDGIGKVEEQKPQGEEGGKDPSQLGTKIEDQAPVQDPTQNSNTEEDTKTPELNISDAQKSIASKYAEIADSQGLGHARAYASRLRSRGAISRNFNVESAAKDLGLLK